MRCIDRGCQKNAIYGFEFHKPTHCTKHREKHQRNCTQRRCAICPKLASCGWAYSNAVVCHTHKSPGMTKIRKPKCVVCGNCAYYSDGNGSQPVLCGKHISPESRNVVFSTCALCSIIMTVQDLTDGICVACCDLQSINEQKSPIEIADPETPKKKRQRVDFGTPNSNTSVESSDIEFGASIFDLMGQSNLVTPIVQNGMIMRSCIIHNGVVSELRQLNDLREPHTECQAP